jgi:hypothetical protein
VELNPALAGKSQYSNPKFQIISNDQMTKFRNKPVSVIRYWNLEIVWDLACLREFPPCGTKAGAWRLVLLRRSQYFVVILRPILFVTNEGRKNKWGMKNFFHPSR